MYVSATFYTGCEDTSELAEELENEYTDFLIASDNSGIAGTNWSEGYITVYTFITNGWGNAVTFDEFLDTRFKFQREVRAFCGERGFKGPSFLYGATYW
jgi:hypothetical protein